MKILLLGKNGQVGWELQRTLAPLGEIIALGRKELDLLDGKAMRRAIRELKPQLIINAAAYTQVDRAEEEFATARMINAAAPGIIAEEARRLQAALVHYSTDYVFDGRKMAPYTEDDKPNPLNAYGHTKLEGEQNIRSSGATYIILRTSWVYGMRGKNFLLTILNLAAEGKKLRIVDDQVGSPTWSRLIAEATALLLAKCPNLEERQGIYHLSSAGETSWHGFARAILTLAPEPKRRNIEVVPIPSTQYKTAAERPAYSVLSNEKIRNSFKISLPHWEQGLRLVLVFESKTM